MHGQLERGVESAQDDVIREPGEEEQRAQFVPRSMNHPQTIATSRRKQTHTASFANGCRKSSSVAW